MWTINVKVSYSSRIEDYSRKYKKYSVKYTAFIPLKKWLMQRTSCENSSLSSPFGLVFDSFSYTPSIVGRQDGLGVHVAHDYAEKRANTNEKRACGQYSTNQNSDIDNIVQYYLFKDIRAKIFLRWDFLHFFLRVSW
mgnify:CR=1 FL=1